MCVFPSKGGLLNKQSNIRGSAGESSWVIRGLEFHFAAMCTDCWSRWRRGVACGGRNLTFFLEDEEEEESPSALQGQEGQMSAKNKQWVSHFPGLPAVAYLVFETSPVCLFLLTQTPLHLLNPSTREHLQTSFLTPLTTPSPMNYNILGKQAHSNNKTENKKKMVSEQPRVVIKIWRASTTRPQADRVYSRLHSSALKLCPCDFTERSASWSELHSRQ